MCLLSNFCCCLSLRAGTISAAIYTIVICVISIITSAVAVWNATKDMVGGSGMTSATVIIIISFIIVILWLIFAILIFVGLSKRTRSWLMPWIVLSCIMVAFSILNAVLTCVDHETNLSSGGQYLNFAIVILIIVLTIYLIITVVSYYRRNMGEVITTQKV